MQLRAFHILSFFIRMPKHFSSLNTLNFSDFEPRIIPKLFLNSKDVTFPNNLSNTF